MNMSLTNGVIDFDKIPISALGDKCRRLLSKNLNGIKVILSEDGFQRDWRGVLDLLRLESVSASTIQFKSDQIGEVLTAWTREQRDRATLGQFQRILGSIDRWDVVDDSADLFGKYQ